MGKVIFMENKIEIFKTKDNQTEVQVLFDQDTVWLSQKQMSELFGRNKGCHHTTYWEYI
jgi:hypothetical protein